MDICVFGAGAVGGNLAARLKEAGHHRISIVARGAHLEAIRSRGLELISAEGTRHVSFDAAEASAHELPPQDIVFVTLKAPSLPSVAKDLRSLLRPGACVVFVTNGVPWWWNYGLEGDVHPMRRLDPEGELWSKLGPSRVIGCVVYSGNILQRPGTVAHVGNNRWLIGEPTNLVTPRVQQVAEVLVQAGLDAQVTNDLRARVWEKLLRNVPFNPLCALTRLSTDSFVQLPELAELAQNIAGEVREVAAAKGWDLPAFDAAEVIHTGGVSSGVRMPGAGRPSMLQDALGARPMEVEAIVGQVQQFAREEKVSTPALDLMYVLLRGLDLSLSQGGPNAQS